MVLTPAVGINIREALIELQDIVHSSRRFEDRRKRCFYRCGLALCLGLEAQFPSRRAGHNSTGSGRGMGTRNRSGRVAEEAAADGIVSCRSGSVVECAGYLSHRCRGRLKSRHFPQQRVLRFLFQDLPNASEVSVAAQEALVSYVVALRRQ